MSKKTDRQAGPAGWYPNPEAGGAPFRWWDGTTWTSHVTANQAAAGPTVFHHPTAPPASPAPASRKGPGCLVGGLAVIGGLVVLGVILAALGGSKTSSSRASQAVPQAAYKIGDPARTSNFEATVFGVKDPALSANEFDVPQPGDHYVAVDVQITNTGQNQQTFSSLLGLHLLDEANHQYDETYVAGIAPSAPGGQIAPGQSIRGFVIFQVPAGTTGLKLRVQGQFTSAGAVIDLSS